MADDTESINIPQVSASDLNPPGTSEDYSDEARELGLDQDYSVTHPNASQEGSPPDSYSQEMSELGLDKDYDVKKAVGPSGAGGSNATTGTGTPKQGNSDLNLSTEELINLKEKDPAGYQAYIDRKTSATRGEFAYGLGDVPRSIARATAAVAPTTFNAIAKAAVPVYASLTGQPQLSPQETANLPPPAQTFQNDLQQRNSDYAAQYGSDPNQQGNRLLGQLVGAGPVMGAINKGVGAVMEAASPYLPAPIKSTLDFLGGNKASNAIVNPNTGRIIQSSTIGNKVGQYLSSGSNAALQAAPLTALTGAGSNTPLPNQLAQNAAAGGAFGTVAPAVLDSGIGLGKLAKRMSSSTSDTLSQKIEGVLQQTAGGLPVQMDTTEYVPGSHPTTAQAAAYAGDPNAANLSAVERVVSQAKPGNENLVSPVFSTMDQANDEARRNAVLSLTGTPQDVADIRNTKLADANVLMGSEAQRAVNPSLPQGTVWANAGQADTSKVLDAIKRMQQGPASGNAELQSHLSTIQDLLEDPRAHDPQFIYESIVKPHVIDIANSDPFKASSAGKSTIKYLQALKPALDDTIEGAAPGYAPYRQAYSAASAQGDRLEALQNLGLVNHEATQGPAAYPTLNKVNLALKKISQNVNNTSPTNKLQYITPEDVNVLQAIQKDLIRQQSPDKLLQVPGSPTSLNTRLTENLTNALGMGEPKGLAKAVNPPTVLSALGTAGGTALGSLIPLPYAAEGGAMLGGSIGTGIGLSMQAGKRAASSQAVNKLVDLMSNPANVKAYQAAQASGGSLLRNVGEIPQLQKFLGAAAPVAALGYNKTNALPVSGQ